MFEGRQSVARFAADPTRAMTKLYSALDLGEHEFALGARLAGLYPRFPVACEAAKGYAARTEAGEVPSLRLVCAAVES
jgi:hypothetical protein